MTTNGTAPSRPLSPTERTVFVLMADGLTNREIAKQLHRATSTIDGHRTEIYRKLGIRNHAEAARMAVALGVVPVEFAGVARVEASTAEARS